MFMNGMMIDCCRILERQEYYYQLIDFMSDWEMTHLQLHFTDNHGCAISIPGFSHLAMPNAFSADDIKQLCAYAATKNIDIIPELEAFGHTQYLTDHPKHRHLFAGYQKEPGGQKGGGVNPLAPEGASTMRRLIDAVIAMFPSKYIHLGCDEVNMSDFLREKGVSEEVAWSDYVNGLADHVRKRGKTPIIWADQLKKRPATAEKISRETVVMEWDYEANVSDVAVKRLAGMNFQGVIASPAVMFLRYRFFPTEVAFKNTQRMARNAVKHNLDGVMNTAWCPHRYVTNALYYAIAYSASLVNSGGNLKIGEFRKTFAKSVFGTGCGRALERFLCLWTRLNISGDLAKGLLGEQEITEQGNTQLLRINELGRNALEYAQQFEPARNEPIWQAMVLSARVAWICSESHCAPKENIQRRSAFKATLDEVIVDVEREWDRTRYPDDPNKFVPHFIEPASSYLIPLLHSIRKQS